MKGRIILIAILLMIDCKNDTNGQSELKNEKVSVSEKEENQLTIQDFEGSWYYEKYFDLDIKNARVDDHTEGLWNHNINGFKIWKDMRGFQFQIRLYPNGYDSYFPRSRYEINGNEIRIFYKEPDVKKEIEVVHLRVIPNGKACILSYLGEEDTAIYGPTSSISLNCNAIFFRPNPDPLPGNWNNVRHKKHRYTRTYPLGGIGGTSELDADALDAVKEEEKE